MTTWTIDELKDWDKKICESGKKFGLDWYPIDYEIIDFHEMIGAMAYVGLPTHYRHWSFGKSFEQTHTRYNLGMEGLPYEMIINSNPSIAYLMKENPLSTHLLTMSHCLGHSDFFKHNRMFKNTDADNVLIRFKSAAKRINKYMEDPSIGIERVERILDAAHSIKFQLPRTPEIKRRKHEDVLREYKDLKAKDKDGKYDHIDLDVYPLKPDYNLLAFIRENSRNLEDWERDVISIVENESHYFIPQAYTKIMNEGWAVFFHEKIMNDLDLPAELHIPFVKLHNQVVRPHLGRVNPYHLGYKLFKKIEEEQGIEACFIAREVHDDVSFVRKHLDEKMCRDLNLFTYSFKKNKKINTIDEISDKDGWTTVRDNLIKNVGLNSIPIVRVEKVDTKTHTLVLHHEHDGRDLELSFANKVIEHVVNLWGDEVKMFSIVEDEIWEF